VFFLMAVLPYVLVRRWSGRKFVALALIALVVLVSQSPGVLIATAVGIAAALFITLWRRRRYVFALVIIGAGAVVGLRLADTLVTGRAADNAASVTVAARGLTNSSVDTGWRSINILVALQGAPIVAAVLIVSIALFAVVALRSLAPAPVLAVAMFGLTAVFAQPAQYQIGAWIMLAMVVLALTPPRPPPMVERKQTRQQSAKENQFPPPQPLGAGVGIRDNSPTMQVNPVRMYGPSTE
jgi:hypothetical protein